MYFSTHYKNRNWNLLWEFYSFLSFKIRILDLAFNIWSYHFSPILVHDLFQSLSHSSYPRNFFRIDLMKKKYYLLLTIFFASLKNNINCMKILKKQFQTLILNGLYNSFIEVFLIFFCVDADRGIHK